MTEYLFDPAPVVSLPVTGQDKRYPVRRIFCVGRNYAAHAAEMGAEVDREAPFYFTKMSHALKDSGGTIAYAPGTDNFHHEMELVFALGEEVFRADAAAAEAAIWGYAAGLDMTRRDLQNTAKEKRRPWDTSKDFEEAAVIAALTPKADAGVGPSTAITLDVNGERRQETTVADMIHSCVDIVVDLSKYYHLGRGDIIMTGTPAGVASVQPGDVLRGEVGGCPVVEVTIGPAE